MKKGTDHTGVSVVFICHDGDSNYLIAKRTENCRDEHNTWEPGGGGLRFGEKIEDAIHREVQEEYRTSVLSLDFLGFRDVHREHDGDQTHWVALDFKVHINREQVQIGEPDKCSELRWVAIGDMPEPLHSQFPYFLDKYKHLL